MSVYSYLFLVFPIPDCLLREFMFPILCINLQLKQIVHSNNLVNHTEFINLCNTEFTQRFCKFGKLYTIYCASFLICPLLQQIL